MAVNKEFKKALEDFGLTKKEAGVYLVLLEFEEARVGDIAKKVKIPRTTLYSILESLENMGLAGFFIKRHKKYFIAERPEKLLSIIKEREKKIQTAISQLKLTCFYACRGPVLKPKILCYDGKEGIKTIFRDILSKKRDFLAITSIEDINKILKTYFAEFIQKRINQNLRVKLLTNQSPQALKIKRTDEKELRETRFLSPKYRFSTANYIYSDRIAILSLKKFPAGIIIEDSDIAETQRMYFDILWEQASR